MKTIAEVYNQYDIENDNGIFYQLYDQGFLGFMNFEQEIFYSLDYDYIYNHSGTKYISPLFEKFLEAHESSAFAMLARFIYAKFGKNWKRIYETYFNEQYNPIENYKITEEEKQSTKITTDSNIDNNAYGYDSVNPAGVTQQVNKQTITGNANDNVLSKTRSGNIGVTTNQKLLSEELRVRQYDFFKTMMKDFDKVLCLKIYA